MDKEYLFQQLNKLPEELQIQVLDFIEFLIQQYPDQIKNNNENEEISDELKSFLLNRLEKHRKNPENASTLEEMEERLLKKFGYEL